MTRRPSGSLVDCVDSSGDPMGSAFLWPSAQTMCRACCGCKVGSPETSRAVRKECSGGLCGNDGLHWPRRDGLKWPHLASVVVGVDFA